MSQAQFKPGKIGTITTALQLHNIGIDGKTLAVVEKILGRVQTDNPQPGDTVEYKQATQGPDKGWVIFFAIKKRAGETLQTEQPAPVSEPAAPKEEPAKVQDIQAVFVKKEQVHVTLKDCVGDEQVFRADLGVIKMLAKPDSPVQAGKKYKVRLVQKGEEWMVANMGSYDESFGEKPFKTGNDILKENLDAKKAEREKAEAALAQIKKENAEGDQRIKENAESLKTPSETEKPVPEFKRMIEAEKCQQNEAVTAPATPGMVSLKDCPVELKIHLDCGSYSNFDFTAPGLPIDQAIEKIEQDGMKAIALMHRLMAAAKKGY